MVEDRFEQDSPLAAILTAPGAAPSEKAKVELRATPEQVFMLVYAQVRKLAGRRDVDDLAQAAAEQAIRALPSFGGRSQLATWTHRIAYLTILKHDRWYRRWLRRFTFTPDGELPEREQADTASEEAIARGERLVHLRRALQKLSPKRRAVVVLHDLEGLPVDEIATIVNAPPLTVRSRLRDGRKTLAQLLAQDPYFGDDVYRREVKK
jgi:RNA polymerase sigma-70 factor (ECF subfamily)